MFMKSRFKVKKIRKPLTENPEVWFRVVYLANISVTMEPVGSQIERLVIEASAHNADVFILGGNFVNDISDSVAKLSVLDEVPAHLGRYFVLGEKDYKDDPAEVRSFFKKHNFKDLTNSHITIMKHGRAIQMTGLDDSAFGAPISPPWRMKGVFPHLIFSNSTSNTGSYTKEDTDFVLAADSKKSRVSFSKKPHITVADFGI